MAKAVADTPRIADTANMQQKFLWAVFIVYCILVVLGVMHHESWADEAQAWLLARDNTPAGIISILPDEGHPPFWYIPLYLLSHTGIPYQSMQWLTAAAMILAVYLFLFRSKAHIIVKLLIPFSYFFLFEYALLARSYCMGVLLCMSIVALYPKRFDKPWLFALLVVALGNTHVILFGTAVALRLLYIIDGVQYKTLTAHAKGAIALMAVGLLYLIPYMSSSQMAPYYKKQIEHPANEIKTAIVNAMSAGNSSVVAYVALLALLVLLARRSKPLLLALVGIAGLLAVVAFTYESKIRHQGLMYIILLLAYLLTPYYTEDKFNLKQIKKPFELWGSILLAALVLLQLPTTAKRYKADNEQLYSGAQELSEYLNDNLKDSSIVVAYQATSTLSVLPYLSKGVRFYYAECERYGTYYLYDTCFKKEIWMYPVDYAVNIAHDKFTNRLKDVVFLFNYPIMPRTQKYLDLQFTTSEAPMLWEERFYVYKFKEGVK